MTTTIAPLGSLTSPVTVAGLPLANRFVMAPMTRAHAPGGVPGPEMAAYYRRRAAGGVGLIVTEGVLVDHPSAGHQCDVPRLTPGPAVDGWRAVTAAVRAEGGRIAAQLWHQGSERSGTPVWTPATMTGADVGTLLEAYAASARGAVAAGFDAVEIHAAHGYLLDEFLWPLTNRRTDTWGGNVARRAALPTAVIRAVRDVIPAAMPLIVRFSQFKERDFGARIAESPAELETILTAFAEAGADVLHASQRRFWEPAFAGDPRNLAGWAARLTGLPAVTVGSVGLTRDFLTGPRLGELVRRTEEGEFDLVALGRILLGNPAWVRLAAAGRFAGIRDYARSDEQAYG